MSEATPVHRRPKMTIENQMKASQWLFKNTAIVGNMTLGEITGAIIGQAKVDQTLALSSVRRLMEAAGLAWKPSTKRESKLKLQSLYDRIVELQGRIERQDEFVQSQQRVIEALQRRVDAVVENTNWVSVAADE